MSCGHQALQTRYEALPEDTFQGLGTMIAVGPPSARQQVVPMYSAYLGLVHVPVDVDPQNPDNVGFCATLSLGNRNLEIKLVDAQQHGLASNRQHSLHRLRGLSAPRMSVSKNTLCYQASLLVELKIAHMTNQHDLAEEVATSMDFDVSTDAGLRSRLTRFAKEDLGVEPKDLLSPNTSNTLATYKAIYHKISRYNANVDIMFNTVRYVEYLHRVLGRVSINSCDLLYSVVNVKDEDNAYWTGKHMVYGAGRRMFYALACADVVAHELTHGLIQDIVNLKYKGHSGAMNEGGADFCACCFEFDLYENDRHNRKLRGKADWLVGEDIMQDHTKGNLRNLEDPHKSGTPQPATFRGRFWVDPNGSFDHGGVHINSGVFNKLFFLICQRLPTKEAGLLLWYNTMKLLKPTSDFIHLRDILLHLNRRDTEACLAQVGLGPGAVSDQAGAPGPAPVPVPVPAPVPVPVPQPQYPRRFPRHFPRQPRRFPPGVPFPFPRRRRRNFPRRWPPPRGVASADGAYRYQPEYFEAYYHH
jgi:hypothetical protein